MSALYAQYTAANCRGKIRLGLCCINNQLRNLKVPVFCSRTTTRAHFTVAKAQELGRKNCEDILPLLQWNQDHNISLFRLSSDLFPHYTDDHVADFNLDFAVEPLQKAGEYARQHGHRVVMHPGQYNQVGAKDPKIFQKTVDDLSMHARVLNMMGMDSNGVLIVHGGGTYGDKETTTRRWIEQFDDLPSSVKSRLVIENCERQYTVDDCLAISEQTKIPVVFDIHHYNCYNTLHPEYEVKRPLHETMLRVCETWKDRIPLMHISNSREGSANICAHSDMISRVDDVFFYLVDKHGVRIDLEVEAKAKEAAIMDLYQKHPEVFLPVTVSGAAAAAADVKAGIMDDLYSSEICVPASPSSMVSRKRNIKQEQQGMPAEVKSRKKYSLLHNVEA